jgi:hypothetical protein
MLAATTKLHGDTIHITKNLHFYSPENLMSQKEYYCVLVKFLYNFYILVLLNFLLQDTR